jgi:hypothetical protein
MSMKCTPEQMADSLCYPQTKVIRRYLDQPHIRSLLGVNPELGPFQSCSRSVGNAFNLASDGLGKTWFYVAALLEHGECSPCAKWLAACAGLRLTTPSSTFNHFQASTSCFTSARCDRPDGFFSLIPALTLSCPRLASQYDYICNRSALIDPPSSRDSPVPPR